MLKHSAKPLSSTEISQDLGGEIPQRTLRRWLSEWVATGVLTRLGNGRATRYQFVGKIENSYPTAPDSLTFLSGLDADLKISLLNQLRDLWTHTSTALEGNILSLGDTHFILEEGLTISGKPIKDHQEVIGHARAIELLYQCLNEPLSESIVTSLHQAVQTEKVVDIYKPNGAWKVEPNSTYAISPNGEQVFIEYALPVFVPVLMAEVIELINTIETAELKLSNAHDYYARIHMGIVHIHPFWDGNGRVARLIANIPLLKAGLPPLIIPTETRRSYIQILSRYQISTGQLNKRTGVWPNLDLLDEFSHFCASCYDETKELVAMASDIQKAR
jgi:Fic family protein